MIDAPPRLLTGVVNALTASTHVLVPTILDGQSLNATLNTLAAIQQFRMKLNPQLQVLGVVPSMIAASTGYSPLEETFIESLERQIPPMYNGIVPLLTSTPICQRQELAKAGGSEILFSSDGKSASVRAARDMFRELGQSIGERLRWTNPIDRSDVYVMPGQDKRALVS
ncbi:MAG: ParA family protein [Hyphomicrobium sp.]|nr:ParA family protein [Hyphomicrobium sp.]